MNENEGKKDNGDLAANVRYLSSILDKVHSQVEHLDTQANIVIGLSMAIFIFASSRLMSNQSIVFFVLGICAAIASIIGLLAIHPPRRIRNKASEEIINLGSNKAICNFESADEYAQALSEVLDNQELITKQYAIQIYNMCNYYYRPKRKLYSLSRDILLIGISLGAIIYVVEYLIYFGRSL